MRRNHTGSTLAKSAATWSTRSSRMHHQSLARSGQGSYYASRAAGRRSEPEQRGAGRQSERSRTIRPHSLSTSLGWGDSRGFGFGDSCDWSSGTHSHSDPKRGLKFWEPAPCLTRRPLQQYHAQGWRRKAAHIYMAADFLDLLCKGVHGCGIRHLQSLHREALTQLLQLLSRLRRAHSGDDRVAALQELPGELQGRSTARHQCMSKTDL